MADKNLCKLAIMICMNFGYFLVELGVGTYSKSMSLVADSFHMLSDVAALVVAFFAVKMSQKKWSKNTYGWARAEVLGALVNSVFLIALCFSIFIDSIKRFIKPEPLEEPLLVLIVGAVGLLMNIVGLFIFSHPHSHSHGGGDSHGHSHGHSHEAETDPDARKSSLTHSNRLTRMVHVQDSKESQVAVNKDEAPESLDSAPPKINQIAPNNNLKKDPMPIETPKNAEKKKIQSSEQMNIRGVFLHVMADALGSVIVVISAAVATWTNWEYNIYLDPALSVVMVFLILMSVCPLMIESSLILLQSVPEHINVDEIERDLLRKVDGVLDVHELHIWQLSGDKIIATAHMRCRTIEEYFEIAEKVKGVFHDEGIHSTTIQPEFCQHLAIAGDGHECCLSCSNVSTVAKCEAATCCSPNSDKKNPIKTRP